MKWTLWWYCCSRQPVFGHASLLVFAHTPSASNFHGPHFLLLDTLYIYLSFCYPIGCAATGSVPCQRNTWRLQSKLVKTLPQQKLMWQASLQLEISVVTLIRTDTTLDVYGCSSAMCTCMPWLPTFWVHRRLLNPLTYKLLFTMKKQQSWC